LETVVGLVESFALERRPDVEWDSEAAVEAAADAAGPSMADSAAVTAFGHM
jgi:hypothetical protein